MSDKGAEYADKRIRDIERSLRRIYSQAQTEIEKRTDSFFTRLEQREKSMQERVKNGSMAQEDFDKWKSDNAFYGKSWQTQQRNIADVLARTNEVANNMIRDNQFDVFAQNGNYAGYELEHGFGMNFGFDLYDKRSVERLIKDKPNVLPFKKLDKEKDVKWNFKNIRAQVTQGILQGESIPKIAKRLSEVVPNRNAKQMALHARTAMTSAQNGGRLQRYKEAKALGLRFKKVWLAGSDGRVRDLHVELNGQAVDVDEDFEVDGFTVQYPGDPWGEPEMVYNCRCTMITELDKDHPFDFSEDAEKYEEIDEDQSFEEWKKEKRSNSQTSQRASSKSIIEKPERPHRYDYDRSTAEGAEVYENALAKYKEQRALYEQQSKSVIDSWLNEEKKYTTKDDVIKWAKDKGVTVTQEFLDNVDPRLYDEILKVQTEMFERFPEVKAYQDVYLQWRLNYELTVEYFMEASAGLNVSGQFQNAEWTFENLIENQTTGFTTLGDGTLSTCIRHEYGHNTDAYCRDKFSTLYSTYEDHISGKEQRRHDARDAYERELISITEKYGSKYSKTNTAEAFAEGFSEFTSNPNSEYGKAFGGFFERWYYANPIE